MILTSGTILQLIVQSLLLSLIYALMALGLNMIYGVMKAVNWAHGAFVMIGAYTAYWLFEFYRIDPLASAMISALLLASLGAVTYDIFIKPFHGMRYFRAIALILTYSLSILLINIIRYLWTDVLRGVNIGSPPITLGAVFVSRPYLYGGLVALLLSLSFHFFLTRTYTGKAMRAVSQNRRVAMLMGINPDRVSRIIFVIGSALAGVTGSLISTIFAITPEMGTFLGIKAITIVVLGGLGSYQGAVAGSLMAGSTEVIGTYFFGVRYQALLYFFTLLLTLMVKPTGIVGEE